MVKVMECNLIGNKEPSFSCNLKDSEEFVDLSEQ